MLQAVNNLFYHEIIANSQHKISFYDPIFFINLFGAKTFLRVLDINDNSKTLRKMKLDQNIMNGSKFYGICQAKKKLFVTGGNASPNMCLEIDQNGLIKQKAPMLLGR